MKCLLSPLNIHILKITFGENPKTIFLHLIEVFKTRRIITRVQGKKRMESNVFSSQHIQNEVLTITYEHPYSKYDFDRKFQANISPSDQSYEKQEKELIKFK